MAFLSFWQRCLTPAPQKFCPMCEGKRLEQANQLVESGYYVGAVATARCELETRLKQMSMFVSNARGEKLKKECGTHLCAKYLFDAGVITVNLQTCIEKVLHRAASVIHHRATCNCIRARFIVREVEKITSEIDAVVSSDGFSLWESQLRKKEVALCVK